MIVKIMGENNEQTEVKTIEEPVNQIKSTQKKIFD
jgi:hypothetical protein